MSEPMLRRAVALLDLPHDVETCVAAWRAFSMEVDHGFLGLPPDATEMDGTGTDVTGADVTGADVTGADGLFRRAIEIDGRRYDGKLIAAVIEDGLDAIARRKRLEAARACKAGTRALETRFASILTRHH